MIGISFSCLLDFFFLVVRVDITSLILITYVIFSLLHLAELNCKIETRRLQISVSSWKLIVSVSVVTNHCYMCFVVVPQKASKALAQPLITVSQLFHFPGAWSPAHIIGHHVRMLDKHAHEYLEAYFSLLSQAHLLEGSL